MEEIEFIKVLSSGTFGVVATIQCEKRIYAIKVTVVDTTDPDFDSEFKWMRKMRFCKDEISSGVHSLCAFVTDKLWPPLDELYHYFVQRLVDSIGVEFLIIVMPYVVGVTMRKSLDAVAVLSTYNGLKIKDYSKPAWIRMEMRNLTNYCYTIYEMLSMSHNDLKLGNIISTSVGFVGKVIDLTFATARGENYSQKMWRRGTPVFMPPEKIFFKEAPKWMIELECTDAGDIWAIGVLEMSMLLSGFIPVEPLEKWTEGNILAENRRFSVGHTDTVYQLMRVTRDDWFQKLIHKIETCEYNIAIANEPKEFIEQAVMMCLWRAATLDFKCGRLVPGKDVLPFIETTKMYVLLNQFEEEIYHEYHAKGEGILSKIYATLVKICDGGSETYWRLCQEWNPYFRQLGPMERRGLERRVEDDRNTVIKVPSIKNPFEWLAKSLAVSRKIELRQGIPRGKEQEDDDTKDVVDLKDLPVHSKAGIFSEILVKSTKDPCRVCLLSAKLKCDHCHQRFCQINCFNYHQCGSD